MGASSIWVCHTCRTICDANGQKDLLHHKQLWYPPSITEVRMVIKYLPRVISGYGLGADHVLLRVMNYLNLYLEWRKRHKGHNISVTNDYATDFMDFEGYKKEEL